MPWLPKLLDDLEAAYGPLEVFWPTDPYLFLVWWHCGYPASDAACIKGWAALEQKIVKGAVLGPEMILAANKAALASAMKAGGIVPELRAERQREIALRVRDEFGGDLAGALRAMPVAKARIALKTFPNIADPGADRILLFAGIAPVAAVPSNCPHVVARIHDGEAHEDWSKCYKKAQTLIADELAEDFDARMRAFLLLKRHGQEVCKRNPKCAVCAVRSGCAYPARQ